jgi:hypothetical protein
VILEDKEISLFPNIPDNTNQHLFTIYLFGHILQPLLCSGQPSKPSLPKDIPKTSGRYGRNLDVLLSFKVAFHGEGI